MLAMLLAIVLSTHHAPQRDTISEVVVYELKYVDNWGVTKSIRRAEIYSQHGKMRVLEEGKWPWRLLYINTWADYLGTDYETLNGKPCRILN